MALSGLDDPVSVAVVSQHIDELVTTGDAAAIGALFDDFPISILEDAPPGTSLTLNSSGFSATMAKVNLSGSTVVQEVVDMFTSTGIQVTMAFAAAPEVILGSADYQTSQSIDFVVDAAVPALQQRSEIGVTMVTFTNNHHGNGSVPPNITIRLDSPITSLTLCSGTDAIKIAGTEAVRFSMPYDIPQYTTAELQCGAAQAQCNMHITELNHKLEGKASECERLARRAVFSGRDEIDLCIEELEELRSNATRTYAECAALPAACEGRGNCTGTEEEQMNELGRCVCNSGWSGAQCDSQRLCRFWDEGTSSWSTDGCRVLAMSENLMAGVGSLLCACDHLTDFVLAADVLSNPGAFFNSLATLEINVPIPLSLSEFLTDIANMKAGHWIGLVVLLVIMRAGLRWATKVCSLSILV